MNDHDSHGTTLPLQNLGAEWRLVGAILKGEVEPEPIAKRMFYQRLPHTVAQAAIAGLRFLMMTRIGRCAKGFASTWQAPVELDRLEDAHVLI